MPPNKQQYTRRQMAIPISVAAGIMIAGLPLVSRYYTAQGRSEAIESATIDHLEEIDIKLEKQSVSLNHIVIDVTSTRTTVANHEQRLIKLENE